MIAGLAHRGHAQTTAHGRQGKLALAACFKSEQRTARVARADIEPRRPSCGGSDQGWQRLHAGFATEQFPARDQIAACVAGEPKRVEDLPEHIGRHHLRAASIVMPFDGDAGATSQIADCFVIHRSHFPFQERRMCNDRAATRIAPATPHLLQLRTANLRLEVSWRSAVRQDCMASVSTAPIAHPPACNDGLWPHCARLERACGLQARHDVLLPQFDKVSIQRFTF